LTGILKEPLTPEIIAVDTVNWNITKPQKTLTIDNAVESCYEDEYDIVSVNFTILVGTYHVGSPEYNYAEWLTLRLDCNANTSLGFIYSMKINFSRTDINSSLRLHRDPDRVEAYGINIWRHDSWATSTSEGYVIAKSTNQTNSAVLSIRADWVFINREANHSIAITLETTVFNGTFYITTVMPIQLEVDAP
jgi:hypothetical protein